LLLDKGANIETKDERRKKTLLGLVLEATYVDMSYKLGYMRDYNAVMRLLIEKRADGQLLNNTDPV